MPGNWLHKGLCDDEPIMLLAIICIVRVFDEPGLPTIITGMRLAIQVAVTYSNMKNKT